MKITLQLAISLDGYIARPDGSFDWCFTDQDYGHAAFFASVDSVVMGRRSWDLIRGLGESPDPHKHYYILTRDPPDPPFSNVHFWSGDVAGLRLRMAEAGRRHAWLFGGGEVCGQFAQAGLIDECLLALHPLALGDGIPLFRGLQRDLRLRLLDSRTYGSGLVMLHHQVLPA
ncbi:MAG TPA: dihydrofolate reductase family protein [Nevskiaceae bacterium]|nr:dihydrofolate reductase family protein [Nevskiaceae bacterium]